MARRDHAIHRERRRGDLTVCVADDVAQNWAAQRRKSLGGQAHCSDLAIEMCLTFCDNSENRTNSITARRMISGDVLK